MFQHVATIIAANKDNGIWYLSDHIILGGAEDRDALRYERHKDRARERNLARAAPDKRNKLSRDKERDISEKIALGMPSASTSGGDTQFDSR